MEELKTLVTLIRDLPALAIWVAVGFYVYKVMIIGSIYGVIRYVTGQLFEWLKAQKAREIEYKEARPVLDGITIKSALEPLIAQLHRLRGVHIYDYKSDYIHAGDVDWLRRAIDRQLQADADERARLATPRPPPRAP